MMDVCITSRNTSCSSTSTIIENDDDDVKGINKKKKTFYERSIEKFNSFHPCTRIALILTIMIWKFVMFLSLAKVLYGSHRPFIGRMGETEGVNLGNVIANSANSIYNKNVMRSVPAVPLPGRVRVSSSSRDTDTDTDNIQRSGTESNSNLSSSALLSPTQEDDDKPTRVLHIVTALRDINNGSRGTEAGEDRLQQVFIPILKNSVESMISPPYNYEVDVYLVLGWKLLPERRKLIEDALPEGVGLQVWDDAIPLGYDMPSKDVSIKDVTRGLARQHRFVVKDKLNYYDIFTVFEDDMRVTGEHVHHYLEMSAELKRLREEAPDTVPMGEPKDDEKQRYYGPLTKQQLSSMIPGFIRVEVLVDEEKWPSQPEKALGSIPVDLEFPTKDGGMEKRTFDPASCCHVPENLGKMPHNPSFDQIMIWETGVKGTVVRQMPEGGTGLLDWVMLQPGPKNFGSKYWSGGYWSGRDGAYGDEKRPGAGDPKLIAQQGGWMLTRDQIIEMHLNHCNRDFFPPFESPENGGHFGQDGLTLNNVEFWSGGFSIFSGTRAGCNMQRVINVDPDHFSKHFLYHTANNKQKTLDRNRFLKANNFLGQINSVVKAATKAKLNEISQ